MMISINSKFHVSTTKIIELTSIEAKAIFKQYLTALKDDCWTRNGRVFTEHVTSHRFDSDIGAATDKKYEVLVAVENLEKVLKAHGI